jgi:ABC-type siderophore export system fused ATPase/permease subunit
MRQIRTAVVISHDERYYPIADRIVRLEYGRLVSDQPPSDRTADQLSAQGVGK